jgi:DNA-binding MarR family transcriptional regulator
MANSVLGDTQLVPRNKKAGAKSARTDSPQIDGFDDEGVRLAILAALEAVYECFPHITLPQYLITLEVRKAERDGSPHTLASIVKKLKMPFSTASRVVWSLTEEGGDIGIIRYLNHPTDRRKKLLVINERNEPNEIPRAITRAMLDYYGDAVRQLKGS